MKNKNRLDPYLTKNPKGIGVCYILNGHDPVPEPDLLKWAEWSKTADHRVSKDIVVKSGEDVITVATVFLGLKPPFTPDGPPLLFETMVFGGEFDEDTYQYPTWDEALEGHNKVAEKIKKHLMQRRGNI